jgi:hypothetical protein
VYFQKKLFPIIFGNNSMQNIPKYNYELDCMGR